MKCSYKRRDSLSKPFDATLSLFMSRIENETERNVPLVQLVLDDRLESLVEQERPLDGDNDCACE